MTDVLEAIAARRSVRRYRPDPVPRRLIERMIEAAACAPSAHDKRPWRFEVIADDAALRAEVSALSKYRDWISVAPCLVIVYLDRRTLDDRIFNCELKHHEAIGAAIQGLMVEAASLGLGTCWIGEIARQSDRLMDILETPADLEFVAMVAVGYPATDAEPRKREPAASSIVSWR